jgi:hypothetical protein
MNYSLDMTKIILIIIVLSILGLNVFNYLARASDVASEAAKDVIGTGLDVTKKTVDLSAKGTKMGADIASGIIEGGIEDLERALDVKVVSKSPNSGGGGPMPDDSSSGIQMPKKSGYCYIGTEKGFRSCVYVGKNDVCMSEDVYPSIDICINPKLRA